MIRLKIKYLMKTFLFKNKFFSDTSEECLFLFINEIKILKRIRGERKYTITFYKIVM